MYSAPFYFVDLVTAPMLWYIAFANTFKALQANKYQSTGKLRVIMHVSELTD